jgi:hypothetical protein
MYAKVKILIDMYDQYNNNIKYKEVEAYIKNNIEHQYSEALCLSEPIGLFNYETDPDRPQFEVIKEYGKTLDDLVSSNDTHIGEIGKKNREIEDLLSEINLKKEAIDHLEDRVDELEVLADKKTEIITRNDGADGYVIIPFCVMDKELADEIYPKQVISKKELGFMHLSATKEILNGDSGKSSLNVKLYNATQDYVENDIDELINKSDLEI